MLFLFKFEDEIWSIFFLLSFSPNSWTFQSAKCCVAEIHTFFFPSKWTCHWIFTLQSLLWTLSSIARILIVWRLWKEGQWEQWDLWRFLYLNANHARLPTVVITSSKDLTAAILGLNYSHHPINSFACVFSSPAFWADGWTNQTLLLVTHPVLHC